MKKEILKCFYCSKDPCCCQLPEVDLKELKRDVQRNAFNGRMLDRWASGYCVAWLIRKIDKLERSNKKYAERYARLARRSREAKQ